MLGPTLDYLNRLPEVAARQWEARKEGIEQEGRTLKMRLNEQKRLDSDGIKANLRGKLSNENFQTLQNEIKMSAGKSRMR